MPALTHDDAAAVMLRAGVVPVDRYPGCQVPWRCRCLRCGRVVTPMYSNVKKGRGGCGYCAGKRTDPLAAAEAFSAAGLEPVVPFPGVDTPWDSMCKSCGARCCPTLSNIRGGQGGCRSCGLLRAGAMRRLDSAQAIATMRDAGFDPIAPYPGNNEPWLSKCLTCGEQVTPRLANVTQRGDGCPQCAGRIVDPLGAAAFMRSAGLTPLSDYPGRHAPWSCRCDRCLRPVSPSYGAVRQGKRCRWCAVGGFNAAESAVVYLLAHPGHHAAKVGVSNASLGRLAAHRRRGWKVLALVPVPGQLALTIEKNILIWWRVDLGLPQFVDAEEMPQRGWTETVELDAIDVPVTIERIRALAAAGLAA